MGQRPNLPPVLPPPRFPIPGGQPLMPGFRPLMPRPLPIPGAPGSLSSPAIKSRSRCPLQEQFLQRKSSRESVLKMVTDVVDKNIVAVSLLSFVAIPIEITGELKVRIVVPGWRFSDGSHILTNLDANPQKSLKGSSNLLSKTVRKLKITVVEAKDLAASDIFGKFDPYVKYQYGKEMQMNLMVSMLKTKVSHLMKTLGTLSGYLFECNYMPLSDSEHDNCLMTPDSVLELAGLNQTSSGSGGYGGMDCRTTLACTATTEIIRKKRSGCSAFRPPCRPACSSVMEITVNLMRKTLIF